VRGLVVNGFTDGIVITGAGATDNTVSGSFMSTDSTGQTHTGNGTGVRLMVGAKDNGGGGLVAADRNVLSGNRDAGVVVSDRATERNRVQTRDLVGPGSDGARLRGQGREQHTGVIVNRDARFNAIGAGPAGALKRRVVGRYTHHCWGMRCRD
jgi:hypothetical protein